MSTTRDWTSPWTAELDGNALPRHDAYDQLVLAKVFPTGRDPDWSRIPLYLAYGHLEDSWLCVQDCVLALSRLRMIENKHDNLWQLHVCAWLHRHQEILLHFQIAPVKVIVDYAAMLISEGTLPSFMVPSLLDLDRENAGGFNQIGDNKDTSSGAESSVDEEEEPTPRKDEGKSVDRAKRSRMTFSHVEIPSKRSRGLELSDMSSNRKPVSRSRNDPAVDLSDEEGEVEREVIDDGGDERLDLSGLRFEEDSPIDLTLVPQLVGQVCDYCKGRRGNKGHPLKNMVCVASWFRKAVGKKVERFVGCKRCFKDYKICSFRAGDWGIRVFPEILIAPETQKRRAARRARRRRVSKAEVAAEPDKTPVVSSSISSKRPISEPVGSSATEKSAAPPTTSVPQHVVQPSFLPSPHVSDRTGTYETDLVALERVLDDPSKSLLQIKQAQTSLRSLIFRRENEIQNLVWVHLENTKMAEALRERADNLIQHLGGEVGESGSSALSVPHEVGGLDMQE